MVQRYGADVAGGAEALCRQTAMALAERGHEVTVLTTTARDYLHWAPHFAAGDSEEAGVTVRRFDAEPADPARAGALKKALDLDPLNPATEREWARRQGPVAPDLLRAVVGEPCDVVAFWTYLYATTQLGLAGASSPAILVPLAHDEPMLRYGITRGVVASADGLAFLTPEERRLVDDLHGIDGRPEAIVGTGIDPPSAGRAARARSAFVLPERFVLYLGRVDAAKGVDHLIEQHAGYRRQGGQLGLVLAGRSSGGLTIPGEVVSCGFVTEQQRADLLEAAEVVALPSAYESLSLVALEAWQRSTPTLANARSAVLAGQTARSGGGLLYDDTTYASQLGRLADSPTQRARLGHSGKVWTSQLTWQSCVDRWESLIAAVLRRKRRG